MLTCAAVNVKLELDLNAIHMVVISSKAHMITSRYWMLIIGPLRDSWGEHQLRQLVRSINMQIKINFRDPAVQHFGGKIFNDFTDKADDVYNTMETPTLSRKSQEREVAVAAT